MCRGPVKGMSASDLLLIFGTETGNAEELAEDAGHLSRKLDFNPKVMDMEDISLQDISSSKRLIVVCSTWGEGEQPVNAQDLYNSVEGSDDHCLEGVNFAVIALGDTAFEFFCESGKEWDEILHKKGGKRVVERIDCDVDYEDYVQEWIQNTLSLMKKIQ